MELRKRVLFMGYSSLNEGLMFPDEIDNNEYCNSIFIVALSKSDNFKSKFKFKICEGEEVYDLDLFQDGIDSRLYNVNFRNYIISFRLQRSSLEYVGSNTFHFDNKELYMLIPLQTNLLEFLVSSENMFFVGDTPHLNT